MYIKHFSFKILQFITIVQKVIVMLMSDLMKTVQLTNKDLCS